MVKTNVLTSAELDLAKEIINIALAKAADSFSFFIQKKVLLNACSVSIEEYNNSEILSLKTYSPVTVLKTEIKGDFDGNCYLLFSEEEKEKTLTQVQSSYANLPSEKKVEMGKAILMEIDNVITASVVTQFSNILNLKIFGYVPIYSVIEKSKLSEFLASENTKYSTVLKIKTELFDDGNEINIEFVWFMNVDVFAGKIRELYSSGRFLIKK